MRLSQLQYFLKVAETGGVNAAARELHVSQPAITTAIRSLEAELGTNLFSRVKQRMILTEEGAFFRSRVAPALEALKAAKEETQAMGTGGGKSQIRLGLPAMIGLLYASRILQDFHQNNPDIELKIVEANTRELRELMDQNRIDLALMIGESPYSKGLERRVLLRTKYSFFVGKEHPLAGTTDLLSVERIMDEPLMLFDEGLFLNQYITDAFQKRDLSPNVVFASSQINAIKEYVGQAMGSTFLIRECVEASDPLVEVPTEITPSISIIVAWQKDQVVSGAMTKLLRYLRNLQ